MTVLKGGPSWERGPSLTGAARIYVSQGQLILAKWPKGRGRNLHPKTLEQMAWFSEADIMAKNASASDWRRAIEMTTGSPFFPRDLLFAAIRGRLYWTQTEDGRTIIPVAAQQDLTNALDMLGSNVGSVLLRHGQLWLALAPGDVGQALVSNGPGNVPSWQNVGGSTGNRVVPQASDFPTIINADSLIMEDSTFGALCLSKPSPGAGINATLAAQDLADADATITAEVHGVISSGSGRAIGVGLGDTGSTRLARFVLRSADTEGNHTISADTYVSPTQFDTSLRRENIAVSGRTFVRLRRQGTGWTFQFSAGGAAWRNWTSPSEATLGFRPNLVGFWIETTSSSDDRNHLAVTHYTNESP